MNNEETKTSPESTHGRELARRGALVAAATLVGFGGLGKLFGPDKALAQDSVPIISEMNRIYVSGIAVYKEYSEKANGLLSNLQPVKEMFEKGVNLNAEIQKKRDQIATIVNRFHQAEKDPLSFRFPSIDPFTVDILNGIKTRYHTFERSYEKIAGAGETGTAKTARSAFRHLTEAQLGEAAVRSQRSELDQLKKTAARNASDNKDQHIGEVMAKIAKPYDLESAQLTNELLSKCLNVLVAIYQQNAKVSFGESKIDMQAIDQAIKGIKQGKGSLVNDKSLTADLDTKAMTLFAGDTNDYSASDKETT